VVCPQETCPQETLAALDVRRAPVFLFVQELKTAYPISLKRLDRRWKELGL
jgi:hypothetical protein